MTKQLNLSEREKQQLKAMIDAGMVARDQKRRSEESELLAGAVPGARMVLFENSTHIPYFEEPKAYRDVLSGFLDAWD